MQSEGPPNLPRILDAQRGHWEKMFAGRASMFGETPSEPARRALQEFTAAGASTLLELGAGQGRDTVFFAQHRFRVTAVEYSEIAAKATTTKVGVLGLCGSVTPVCHDVRLPLPFNNESFDGCYSHMLYCMALTMTQLEALSQEVWRVLTPGGLNIYTVRHTGDPQYGTGEPRGKDMYEIDGGFIVHFFNRQTVERLAQGYTILRMEEMEEGSLPRRLFLVTLRKEG